MSMSAAKSLIKVILVSSLSSTLIANSFAASSEKLKGLADSINSERSFPKDLIARFQKVDLKKAQNLETFITTHPELKNIQFPKTTVEQDSLSFNYEGKKTSITMEKDGVKAGKTKAVLMYSAFRIL